MNTGGKLITAYLHITARAWHNLDFEELTHHFTEGYRPPPETTQSVLLHQIMLHDPQTLFFFICVPIKLGGLDMLSYSPCFIMFSGHISYFIVRFSFPKQMWASKKSCDDICEHCLHSIIKHTKSPNTVFSFQVSLSTLYCSYSENNKCFLKEQGYIQRPEFITVMKKGAFLFQQLIRV